MSAPTVGVLLALATFAAAVAAGWLWAAAASRWTRADGAASSWQARLAPLACAAIAVPLQAAAFGIFEPSHREERVGAVVLAIAAAGALLLAGSAAACVRSARRTRTVVRQWRRSAVPVVVEGWQGTAWQVESSFPIVAVVGVARPELFVARCVVDSCTRAELAAIVAHERAHVSALDNLTRWLFDVTPGRTLAPRLAAALERQWDAAAEKRADRQARDSCVAIDLASALVNVTRMATESAPEPLVGSTLIGQGSVEQRVRALLAPPARRANDLPWAYLALAAGATAVALTPRLLSSIHEAVELLVRL